MLNVDNRNKRQTFFLIYNFINWQTRINKNIPAEINFYNEEKLIYGE